MINPEKYSIRIQLVEDDDGTYYVGTVDEVPGVAAFEASHQDAYAVLLSSLIALQEAAKNEGRDFPKPFPSSESNYSGRVTLRMPSWLHMQMDISAQREQVSLNQYIVSLLSSKSSIEEVVSLLREDIKKTTLNKASNSMEIRRQDETTLIVVDGYELVGVKRESADIPKFLAESNAQFLPIH